MEENSSHAWLLESARCEGEDEDEGEVRVRVRVIECQPHCLHVAFQVNYKTRYICVYIYICMCMYLYVYISVSVCVCIGMCIFYMCHYYKHHIT